MNHPTPSVIFRHQSTGSVGIQTVRYSRNAIGYVEQGQKLIHLADQYQTVESGELFHLSSGTHYIENTPLDSEHPFQQTLFFYTPSDLRNSFTSPTEVQEGVRLCCNCVNHSDLYTYPASSVVIAFYRSLQPFMSSGLHHIHPELGYLKLCELVQLLQTQPGCCICRPVFASMSAGSGSLSEIVRGHIFSDIGLPELATECGMSLSLFKTEFRKIYQIPPHKWITEQRLTHSRLQLITTSLSISEISAECRFNNSSHFIKLFKERFGLTPSVYRRTYDQ